MRFIVGAMMVVFGVSGLALIGLAVRILLLRLSRRAFLVRTVGVITEIRRKQFYQLETKKAEEFWYSQSFSRRRSSRQNFPVITFRNRAGDLITFQSAHGDVGDQSGYHVDDEIAIFYDPAGKMEPIMTSWMAMWGEPLLTAVSGLIFLGASALIWFTFGDRILGL